MTFKEGNNTIFIDDLRSSIDPKIGLSMFAAMVLELKRRGYRVSKCKLVRCEVFLEEEEAIKIIDDLRDIFLSGDKESTFAKDVREFDRRVKHVYAHMEDEVNEFINADKPIVYDATKSENQAIKSITINVDTMEMINIFKEMCHRGKLVAEMTVHESKDTVCGYANRCVELSSYEENNVSCGWGVIDEVSMETMANLKQRLGWT